MILKATDGRRKQLVEVTVMRWCWVELSCKWEKAEGVLKLDYLPLPPNKHCNYEFAV
jgi:hypothetical protein